MLYKLFILTYSLTGERVYFMYDPPHLLKSIRNGLYNTGFTMEGKVISWEHIKVLYNIKKFDKIQVAGKLSENHMNLTSFSKMRVDYAAETLSQSVASGLRSVIMLSSKLPKEAIHTAEFCEFFNCLFDIFNSKGSDSNPYKSGLESEGKSITFLNAALQKLNSIRYAGSKYTNTLPCLLGWRKNVRHMISLYNHLQSEFNITTLTTHNCTQDDVENFFSRIRSGGGNRDNPTANEFLSEYRKISVDSLFSKVRGSNCNLDAGEFLLKLEQLQKNLPVSPIVLNLPVITALTTLPQSCLLDNAISVISLDICEYISKLYCKNCINLVCVSSSSSFSYNILLLKDKNKNNNINIQPTPSFIKYIHSLYILFNHYQNNIIYKENICKLFIQIVSVNNVNFEYCGVCVIVNPVICYFLRRRLSVVLSKDNMDRISTFKNGREKSRKLLKLKHI